MAEYCYYLLHNFFLFNASPECSEDAFVYASLSSLKVDAPLV